MPNSRPKWLLSILGTLLLGALGSGLWSAVLAPIGSSIARGLMSFLTLGITSAKDGTYRMAAEGLAERPSVFLLVFSGAFFLTIVITLFAWVMVTPRLRGWLSDAPSARLVQTSARLRRWALGLSLFNVFLVAVVLVQIMFLGYANTVASRFIQQLTVVAPYITPEQRTLFASRFASVKTRSEFVTVFEELNAIALRNGKRRSDFSPW